MNPERDALLDALDAAVTAGRVTRALRLRDQLHRLRATIAQSDPRASVWSVPSRDLVAARARHVALQRLPATLPVLDAAVLATLGQGDRDRLDGLAAAWSTFSDEQRLLGFQKWALFRRRFTVEALPRRDPRRALGLAAAESEYWQALVLVGIEREPPETAAERAQAVLAGLRDIVAGFLGQ